jgi:hypothetical protein
VGSMSSVGSMWSTGSAKIGASRMSSSRSPPGGEAKVPARLEEGPVELRKGLAVCLVPCRMSPSLGLVLQFGLQLELGCGEHEWERGRGWFR